MFDCAVFYSFHISALPDNCSAQQKDPGRAIPAAWSLYGELSAAVRGEVGEVPPSPSPATHLLESFYL